MRSTLFITESCNAGCCHCTQVHSSNYMTLKRFIQIIEKIEQPGYIIDLFGGEPLQNKDLFKMIEWVRTRDIQPKMKIFTNGILLTEEVYNKLVDASIEINLSFDIDWNQRGYNLIEKNPKIIDIIESDATKEKLITLSFDVTKRPDNILQDFLTLKKLHPNVDWYFDRNWASWREEELSKFSKGMSEFMSYSRVSGLRLPNRILQYQDRIINVQDYKNEVLGCGVGITSFAYGPQKDYSGCGVIDFTDKEIPSQEDQRLFCDGCPVESICPKTCPISIATQPETRPICHVHKTMIANVCLYLDNKDKEN